MAIAPAAKVIMLSMHQDEQRVVQSIRAGASGYLMKDVAVAEVATAIDSVLRGEVFISASARKTVARMLASNEAETSPLSLLTARQREILQLIAEGQSTKEIGYRLSLSTKDGGNAQATADGSTRHPRRCRAGAICHPCRPDLR
jgi:DNA-binding NarL/FixJ family response regulator